MIARLSAVAVLAVLAAGCASHGRCQSTDAAYQHAESVAPLKATQDLKLPESPSALRIPPAPTQTAALPEGQCLESPPRFEEKTEAPATPPAVPAAPAPEPIPAPAPAPEAKP